MPLVRYFVVVAGILLAMLAAANWYVPSPPPPLPNQAAEIDKTTLRIRSEHKWPQKIEFDTAMDPFIAASAPKTVATAAPVAAAPREEPALDALAQAKPPEPEITKPKSKMRTARRAPRSAPRVVVAANPATPGWSFGWGEPTPGPQKQPVDSRQSSRNNWFGERQNERNRQNVASWSWGGSNDW